MPRWYDEHPDILASEIQELEKAGFPCVVDAVERAAGRIVLHIDCRLDGIEHHLKAIFPHEYPYFPFHVEAPALSLANHQNPYSKELCFVADIESEWNVNDTVAKYLTERLPLVIKANADPTAAEKIEAHEGAPATEYMEYMPGSVVVTSDWKLDVSQLRGTMDIKIEEYSDPNQTLRGAVTRLSDICGSTMGDAEPWLKNRYSQPLRARWVRLPGPPKSKTPGDILEEVAAIWPQLRTPAFNGGPDVVGVVFQDHARYRELHDLWIFVVRRRDHLVVQKSVKRRVSGKQNAYLARADRSSTNDLLARVPRLGPLLGKKVVLIGLGALGSPCAWQLARAGVSRLALMDHDVVQVGNLPRWLVGWAAIGHYKADVLTQYLRHHYPYIDSEAFVYRLGAPSIPQEAAEKLTTRFFGDADLVLDCSATYTVSHYLSTLAWRRGIPYVWATGTPGSWGGIVGRAVPGRTNGCWKCFRHHYHDRRYREPAFDSGPKVQPVGCFSPTFTGTGFDMDQLSLMATRIAVATLCRDSEQGYPDFDGDIAVADFWKDDKPIAPDWLTYSLMRHPECDLHG